MRTHRNLKEIFFRIDGKGYKAYKDAKGAYEFPGFTVFIDHVQGDPFATPSRVRARVDRKTSGFPGEMTTSKSRTTALRDFLTRQFHQACVRLPSNVRGTGKSGLILIDRPGQEILERSAMVVNDQFVEARFYMGLPAFGRRISGRDAQTMFFENLPRVVERALLLKSLNPAEVYKHIETSEDADHLRASLRERGLVGFVADGARLPRASGVDSRPMDPAGVVPFRSPESVRTSVRLPNQGEMTGMGVPEGVTLIVGGGYHGKSTLLTALERGVYNHIPGDGREGVATDPDTVKIRAADGRSIVETDISPFINNLPFKKDTRCFSTENASGSTSQAANICEALEAGARALLLDEDTSATNFMIRDLRMQQLISKENEPITPFIDKVRQLYEDKGASTILVMGGSGDYFSTADLVIRMADYLPSDVTARAHAIAASDDAKRRGEGGERFGDVTERIPMARGFNPYRGKNRLKIAATRTREIVFGAASLDLSDVEQIVTRSQTRAIGLAIHYATRRMDGVRTLKEVIDLVLEEMDREGLDVLSPYIVGDLARFRGLELAAAVNRMRTLVMKQKR
ncbi:MAG: ABC-ATPase domain-containing protein [Desulfobacterales bacterium]|nr:ABC-ATPase domain-containing protein [Desulfobacterales bacterium]